MNNSFVVRQMWDEISDTYLQKIYTPQTLDAVRDAPESVFPKEVYQMILDCMGDLQDKKVCILGSGDNLAGFALALLGACVTAVDVSQKQLDGAKKAAAVLGITNMEYVCDDAMCLSKLSEREYDLVLTTNGTLNFISDLDAMFRQIKKILKDGGHYILFDTHPFMRPFAGYLDKLVVKKPYSMTGPFTQAFVYHWRVQDYIKAFAKQQLFICDLLEIHAAKGFFWKEFVKKEIDDTIYDWHYNPLSALPQYIVIAGRNA